MKSNSATPHRSGVRGITLPRSSLLFEGRFGRIFRALMPAEFGDDDQKTPINLNALTAEIVGVEDQAKDGADAEESGVPALYTYLGQFVDHDLTFDPANSLQQQNDIDALTITAHRVSIWILFMVAVPTISRIYTKRKRQSRAETSFR